MAFKLGKTLGKSKGRGSSSNTTSSVPRSIETVEHKYRNNKELINGKPTISTKHGYIGKNIFVARIDPFDSSSHMPVPVKNIEDS